MTLETTKQAPPPAAQKRTLEAVRGTEGTRLPVMLVGALLVLLAVGLFAYVGWTMYDVVTADTTDNAGGTLLRYLNDVGIIVPVLGLVLGVWFLNVARRVFAHQVTGAAWANVIFLWMTVGAVVLAGRGLLDLQGGGNITLIVAVVVGVLSAVGFWFTGRTRDDLAYFRGSEALSSRNARVAWSLLIPTLALLVLVAVRPLEQTFIASLTDQQFGTAQTRDEVRFIGLANYTRLLGLRFDRLDCVRAEGGACAQDAGTVVFPRARNFLRDAVPAYREGRFQPVNEFRLGDQLLVLSASEARFIGSIGNTLSFTISSVAIELVLGLFIALVVNSNFPGRGALRAAMLVPWAIPTVVSARLWETMLRDNQSGVINHLLVNSGLIDRSQAWLANPSLQIPALVMIDVWKTTPFMALILLAGLQVISADLYEAADVDGAGPLRKFFSLTLPLLRPTIAVALVFRTLDAVRAFDLFYVLLGTQRRSMAVFNHEVLIRSQEFGYASAVGVVIFLIILLFTVVYVNLLGVETD